MIDLSELIRLRYLASKIYEQRLEPTQEEFEEFKFLESAYKGKDIVGMLIDDSLRKDKLMKRLKEQRDQFIELYSGLKDKKKDVVSSRHGFLYECNRELEFIK